VRRFLLVFAVYLTASLAAAGATPPSAPKKTLPLPGEVFLVASRTAFLIPAAEPVGSPRKPWVWYAPTLEKYPGAEERWMLDQFLAAGIALAGIDVGESFGNPAGRAWFTALYEEMTRQRGYSPKPVLLGRSRGGLMALAWAADHPDRVGGFAGIYPVCNLVSYPGLAKAAGAYGLSASELESRLPAHNPVDRLAPLAAARVPLFAIHGDVDRIVPLEANSGLMHTRYTALGGTMELIVPAGQGHSMWSGFFQNDALVAFVKANARR
jgi:pimeloyl-ACP methyl ester carboxylesterase